MCGKEIAWQNKRKRESGRVWKRESEYGRYPEERKNEVAREIKRRNRRERRKMRQKREDSES